MALSPIGRKHLLPHGSQRKIARRLGVQEPLVSAVVNGTMIPETPLGWRSYRRVQKAVAKVLNLTVEEAFQDWERGEVQVEESVA